MQSRTSLIALVLTTLIVVAPSFGLAAEPLLAASGRSELLPLSDSLTLTDSAGQLHPVSDWRGQTVVLFFVGLECPVANAYAPEILAQMQKNPQQRVRWLAVHSEPGVTATAAKKHAAEYKLTLPILLDGDQQLAAGVGALRLGQVVVLDDRRVVYRGRIDDRFAINGKRRDVPSTHELQEVLGALAKQESLPHQDVPAYGCPIPFKK